MKKKETKVDDKLIFTGVILNMDGVPNRNGIAYGPFDSLKVQNPVPVNINFDPNRTVGQATIEVVDQSLQANIEFESVDLSVLFNHKVDIYPAVQAVGKVENGKVVEFQLQAVALTLNENADPRIPPLKLDNED